MRKELTYIDLFIPTNRDLISLVSKGLLFKNSFEIKEIKSSLDPIGSNNLKNKPILNYVKMAVQLQLPFA